MKALYDPFRDQIANQISQEIDSLFNLQIAPQQLVGDLATVPNVKMGHVAFPCFRLSKELKKSPKDIAEQLQNNWQDKKICSEVKAIGPYLNIFLNSSFFGENLVAPMVAGDYFKVPPSDEPPVLVEYSQPNTHKELHVGHMRNLCYGHALILMSRYCGNNVITCTFPGDVGTHVAKCLWYMKFHNKEKVPSTHKGEWLGRMYTLANNKLEDELGTDKEESNREQLTAILKQLEQKKGEYYELWKETREWSIELMENVYSWAGVHFDRWFWESEVDSPSVAFVKQLHADGKLIESEGAVGMDLSDEKLGFCMLLKSDGNGLYATKDLELARLKFEEYNPQQNIYIVDMRQELHFKQVFSVFGRLGMGDPEKCIHLKYNFVELPDGAMSSRKGNIIPLSELIEKMKNHVKTEYLSRYKGEWSEEDIERTADTVAKGAICYGMNSMDPNKKIVFDMNEWLRLDGESGPYIQYAHARICSILRKFGNGNTSTAQWDVLTHPSELALMILLSQFQNTLFKSVEQHKTSSLCGYLYDVAKAFSTFYHDCPIGKADNEDVKNARLALADATRTALAKGLELLGIPAPEKM